MKVHLDAETLRESCKRRGGGVQERVQRVGKEQLVKAY